MSQTRLILKNTAYQILSKGLTSIIGLATRKLLTNYLGPAGFGDYVFLLTYSGLFGSIADWGTITISVREASKKTLQQASIFGTAILGRLGLSVVACLLAILFSPLIIKNQHSFSLVVVSALIIIAMATKASFGIIFETLLKMNKWLWVEVSASIFTLGLFFLAVSLRLSLLYFLVFLLLATLVASLIGLFLAVSQTKIDFSYKPELLKHLAKESWPMGLALIMFSLYNRLDTVFLGIFRSVSEVGFYGLAYFIYENLVLIAAYTLNSVYPLLSRSAGAPISFSRLFIRYYQSMLGLGFLAAACTWIFSPVLISVISSPQFYPSIPLLKILSLSLFFSYLNHVTGYSLIALGQQKKYSLITLSALFLNLSLNLAFIPKYGAVASAWTTVGTEALVQLLSLFLLLQWLKSLRVRSLA